MKPPSRSFLLHALLFLWLILCMSLFVFVSQASYLHGFFPGDLSNLLVSLDRIFPIVYILDLLGAFAGILFFSIAAFSLGLGIMRWKELSLARGVTAFILGEIVFSFVFLTVISLYRLTPIFSGCTLLIGFLLGLPIFRSWLHAILRQRLFLSLERWEKTTLVFAFIVIILTTLLPSARLGYDAVAEYFSHAKIMAITGERVFLYAKDPFLVSSLHPGILFTPIIQLFGDQSARLFSWFNGMTIILMGLALGYKLNLNQHARLLFIVLSLTSTFFIDLLGDGKIELITTLPILAAIYWMIDGLENPSRGTFLLIGTLIGFSVISRPYNIFLVSLFLVLFYTFPTITFLRSSILKFVFHSLPPETSKPHPPFRILPPAFFWLFFPLMTFVVFHLWQNAIWLGSPIAPLIYALDLKTSIWQWQFDPSQLNTLRLIYPLTISFYNSPQSLGNISPFFIGFFPLLIIAEIRHNLRFIPVIKQVLVATLGTLFLWLILFFTVVEIRYVMFLWILLFLQMARVIETAQRYMHRSIQAFLRTLPVILLLFIGIRTALIGFTTYSPIDQKGQPHCYNHFLCSFFEPINQLAGPGDRVLVFHAYRYYLRQDLFTCSSRAEDYAPLMVLSTQNPRGFWEEVYRRGYRYITYEYNFAEFHSHLGALPDTSLAPNWLKVDTIASVGDNKIFHITAIQPPYASETACLYNKDGSWEIGTGLNDDSH